MVQTRRRSHGGNLAAAALGIASATGLGFGLNSTAPPSPTTIVSQTLPDDSLTPGMIDSNVTGAEICGHAWQSGPPGSPPVLGGTLTYSKAARATPQSVKDQAFAEYGLVNPHDNGRSYEIDHRVPLSLGGRDVLANLWPQSRTASGLNAWVKDRLEYRLYRMVCAPEAGDRKITLAEAQQALKGDWTKAYDTYCGNEDDCPAYNDKAD